MAKFEGPLPPPSMLAQYDDIVPGAAEKIITIFESQVKHRQELEKTVIKSDIIDSKLGMILGFLISIAAIAAGTYCILNGHSIEGTLLSGGALTGLVSVFVYGSRQRKKERENHFKNR
jgi:uncharacterized membrane protein